MPDSVKNSNEVSHEPIKEDSEVSKGNLPKAAPRKIKDEDGGSRSEDSSNPFDGLEDEVASTNDEAEHIYAAINPETKSPKKSLDSGVPSTPPRRSDSVGSEESKYSTPLKSSEEAMIGLIKNFDETLSYDSRTPTDGSEKPLIPDNGSRGSVSIIDEDRFWPKVRHAVKEKEFVIPVVSAAMITASLAAYSAYTYLQDHAKFIAFITNNPKFITVPSAIAFSLFTIGMACAVSQFKNTREFQIQAKNADANMILDKVFECQPGNKIIKSVRLEYSNGTHSNFTFNIWKSRNNFIDIDEKVINRTSKIGSVINDRPLPVMLLTGVIVANLIIPSALYAIGGIDTVQHFYQNILANNIGLSIVIGSAILAVSALCLVVHDYRKTNCSNLACFHEGEIDSAQANRESRDKIERDRTVALGESHRKEDKCSSLILDQLIVQAHNFSDTLFTVHSIY
ncbi:MAG: hypothetical protein PG981_000331 [Wolbachia endosymbiont of Ctenocephalides orientis wCori]|nr:MAG: hypothetical protein PG981_000331 [Wolbachia endosymbiont of Ctenocephalides orientis wCori]